MVKLLFFMLVQYVLYNILVQATFDIGYNGNGLLLDDVSLCSLTLSILYLDCRCIFTILHP